MLHASLQKIDATPFQIFLVQHVFRTGKSHVIKNVGSEYSLVTDIVNRQHGLGLMEHLIPGIKRLQVDWHQAGVPVVAVENIRDELQSLAHFDRSPGQ